MVSSIRGRGLNVTFRGYQEMTTTGAISKVADEHVRNLLYQWDTVLTGIKSMDAIFEDTRNVVFITNVLEGTAFGNVLQADDRYQDFLVAERFEFDIEDIRANRVLDSALAMRHVQAQQQLGALIDFVAKTKELIIVLDNGVAE